MERDDELSPRTRGLLRTAIAIVTATYDEQYANTSDETMDAVYGTATLHDSSAGLFALCGVMTADLATALGKTEPEVLQALALRFAD